MIQLRGLIVHHHLIIDGDDVHLFDGGFIGGVARIRRALKIKGLDLSNIRSLILTHGHLDHTFNAARIQKLTKCTVYAPRLDQAHLEGRYHYQGRNRLCGWLESIGRVLFRSTSPVVDQWFEDGDEVCGFKVIALPGHTTGHSGFYHESKQCLIASDLFTNHLGPPKPPPRLFNDDHEEALRSIQKAAALAPKEVYLNHSKKSPPSTHAESLQRLAQSLFTKNQPIKETPQQR
ncbi:MBL fold metallo-hydrolase [Verrucomicrobiaceae bacterium 227]